MSGNGKTARRSSSTWQLGDFDGCGFKGDQRRLVPLGSRAVVTPRATSSTASGSSSKSKQTSLMQGFRRQRQISSSQHASSSTSTSRERASDKENKTEANAQSSGAGNRARKSTASSTCSTTEPNDEDIRMGLVKPGAFRSMFGLGPLRQKASTSIDEQDWGTDRDFDMSARDPSKKCSGAGIGKRVLNPSGRDKRAGPTIDFDRSSPSLDDTEMDGESQRRKRARIIEGGPGELDLMLAQDHEGFGPSPWHSARQDKDKGKARAVREPLQMRGHVRGSYNAISQQASPKSAAAAPMLDVDELPSSGPEPSTYNGSYEELVGGYSDKEFEVLLIPSSQDDGDEAELVAMQLLPHRLQKQRSSHILVPNSDSPDPEDEDDGCSGAADDSGFAEMDDLAEPVKSKTGERLLPYGLVAERKSEENREPSSGGTLLSRTPSSVLMPPPPIPSRPSQTATSDARGKTQPLKVRPQDILVYDTQVSDPEQGVKEQALDEEPEDNGCQDHNDRAARRDILVYDTPEPSLGPAGPSQEAARQDGVRASISPEETCDGFETQYTLEEQRAAVAAAPIADKVKTPAKLQSRVEGWNGLESAWAGTRPLTPPKPPSPRQVSLDVYFGSKSSQRPVEGDGEEDDEMSTQCVPESQPGFPTLSVEVARAFQSAFETTREMGRKQGGAFAGRDSSEDEEIVDERDEAGGPGQEEAAVEDDAATEVVLSSDQEDEPWSPLGSPVKARYPTPPSAIGRVNEIAVKARPVLEERVSSQARDTASQPQLEAQASELQDETQWESYWTMASPRIIPLHVDENDSLADMLRDSCGPNF